MPDFASSVGTCNSTARDSRRQDVAFRVRPASERCRTHGCGARRGRAVHDERCRQRAKEVAEHLNKLNGDRQEEEARIMDGDRPADSTDDASLKERYSLVLDGEEWHRGVIGICASRVVDRYASSGAGDCAA